MLVLLHVQNYITDCFPQNDVFCHMGMVNFLCLSLTPCCYVELSFVLYFLSFVNEMRLFVNGSVRLQSG